jgi:hypothetical protein
VYLLLAHNALTTFAIQAAQKHALLIEAKHHPVACVAVIIILWLRHHINSIKPTSAAASSQASKKKEKQDQDGNTNQECLMFCVQ